MRDEIKREDWTEYFKEFSKRNQGRPTKMEVLGELGAQSEEQHLPLAGVSVEDSGKDAPRIEIMLGGAATDPRHLTHTITRVNRVMKKLGADGRDEAIEFEDASGTKTILRFESLAELEASS
ncbi:MAG: DUF5335 domain-containing protein [Acidobacteria bacterium]|nr:DUF5335 domain-containing protein [Acidobacteriota bacterium]